MKPHYFVLIILLLAGCTQNTQNSAAPSTESASTNNIVISNFVFNPNSLTIRVGESVTWINQDSATHTVQSTSGPESFSSSALSQGGTYTFTFNTSGTYTYRCSIHTSMTGTIVVE